jgi:hypothetical protein
MSLRQQQGIISLLPKKMHPHNISKIKIEEIQIILRMAI